MHINRIGLLIDQSDLRVVGFSMPMEYPHKIYVMYLELPYSSISDQGINSLHLR